MNEIAQQLLQPAINMGLSEFDFWTMTKGEVERYLEGAVWRMKSKAQFDYILGDLIGISVARVMSDEVKYPSIEDIYPALFNKKDAKVKEIEEEALRIEDSTNRFLEFALKHNAKRRQGVENKIYDN